jgi:hypothetical protein
MTSPFGQTLVMVLILYTGMPKYFILSVNNEIKHCTFDSIFVPENYLTMTVFYDINFLIITTVLKLISSPTKMYMKY